MLKRLAALLLAALALAAPALAEVYEGTTAALSTVTVASEFSGILDVLHAQPGQRVEAGDSLASLRPQKTFATQDGAVSMVFAKAGDSVDGKVLEVTPLERYTIHCTVNKAYQNAASTLVHSGETVYIKCTADGTHRAIGTITQIDGEEYRVLTIGGELYVGETVYLYRDEDFTYSQRVGIGTVVVTDTEAYEAKGELTTIRVAEDEYVERGQLLYETGGGGIAAPVDGILASLTCQIGDAVEQGQAVAEIVPEGAVCVEIQVNATAAARISPGDAALLNLPGEEAEEAVPGTVVDVFSIADSGLYAVRILPESSGTLALGMSVEVRLG